MELLSTGTKMLETMLMRAPPPTGNDGAHTHQGQDWWRKRVQEGGLFGRLRAVIIANVDRGIQADRIPTRAWRTHSLYPELLKCDPVPNADGAIHKWHFDQVVEGLFLLPAREQHKAGIWNCW